ALQDAQARVDAGLVGSNDVTRFTLELASSERALANSRSLARSALLQLGNLLDSEIELPLTIPDSLVEAARAAPPEALHFAAREPLMRALPSFGLTAQARFTNEQGFSGRDRDWSFGVLGSWAL